MNKQDNALRIAQKIQNDQMGLSKEIEGKLANFSYWWLAYVSGNILLFAKSIHTYAQYVSLNSAILFFIPSFIGIIIVSHYFFKVWDYKGIYKVNYNSQAYVDIADDPKRTWANMVRSELDALNLAIDNNKDLNDQRLRNLDLTKKSFKWTLRIQLMITIFIFLVS